MYEAVGQDLVKLRLTRFAWLGRCACVLCERLGRSIARVSLYRYRIIYAPQNRSVEYRLHLSSVSEPFRRSCRTMSSMLYLGIQHSQDFADCWRCLASLPAVNPGKRAVSECHVEAHPRGGFPAPQSLLPAFLSTCVVFSLTYLLSDHTL